MYLKKNIFSFGVLLFLWLNTLTTNVLLSEDFDIEDLESLDIPERTVTSHTDSCAPITEICELLTDCDPGGICLQKILLNNIYLHTNPINVRSLLDSPQYYFYNCFDQNFFVNVFFNMTPAGYYTIDGTNIASYLNTNQPGIINAIGPFCPENINIPSIVSLVEPFRIQERRAGFMFGGRYVHNNWYAKYYFPLYYLERNFFLNNEEKRRLEEALDVDTGPVSDAEGTQFARKHLITDRVGIGDTRLVLGYELLDRKDIALKVGAIATIPSAFAFAKGLYGSHFLKNSAHPTFNLQQILSKCLCSPDQMDTESALELATQFGLSVVDKLTANLLDRSLGNNGHVGLGAFIEPHHKMDNYAYVKGRVCLEYLLPAIEKRSFIRFKNPADFNRDFDCSTDAAAQANVDFLNEQLIQTLIPCVYDTTIWPGLLIKATAQGTSKIVQRLKGTLGLDLWFQSKESFGKIDAPADVRPLLRTDIAKRPHAVQTKIFGWLDYKTKKKDWCISMYVDGTWASFGIGKDYTLAVRFEKKL